MTDAAAAPDRRIVVLGVGNLLWADEGFGVRCVEALDAGWDLPPDVGLMDGGTLSPTDYLRNLTKVILSFGRHGKGVIVGRGAQYILDPKRTLRIRIDSPPTMPSRAFRVFAAISSPCGMEISISTSPWRPSARATSAIAAFIILRGTGLIAGSPGGTGSPGKVTVPTPGPALN